MRPVSEMNTSSTTRHVVEYGFFRRTSAVSDSCDGLNVRTDVNRGAVGVGNATRLAKAADAPVRGARVEVVGRVRGSGPNGCDDEGDDDQHPERATHQHLPDVVRYANMGSRARQSGLAFSRSGPGSMNATARDQEPVG